VSRAVVLTRTAKRKLTPDLPEPVAAAAWELIQGDLRDKPRLVGKPLMEPYTGEWSARRGTYRIRYRFDEKTVTILTIKPRSTAYRALAQGYAHPRRRHRPSPPPGTT
jgi:mRNA interferase RelE/StbE